VPREPRRVPRPETVRRKARRARSPLILEAHHLLPLRPLKRENDCV
jgi:hypothetical protein